MDSALPSANVTAVVIPSLYSASQELGRRRGPGFLDGFAVEQEHVWITGFTVYVVEQWIVDRDRTLSTIVVYTGNEADKLAVDVLVPSAELGNVQETLMVALSRLRLDAARPKETQYGVIHVTTLPSFRSDLNIVQIPGSVADYREHIYANIALRRMGCGTRTGLSIQAPNPAQCEKFYGTFHLHAVSGELELVRLVLSLIRLVQNALSLYGMGPFGESLLAQGPFVEDADGLLCDETVAGINRFSLAVGERLCRAEPGEGGVLSPSALAILLTSIISLRARINALGSHHVPSDPFASRRRFLQVYRTYVGTLGFSDRGLTVDALLAVRRNMQDHPEGFIKSRLKSTIEEVSRLTDVTGDRKSMPEEETGDLLLFVNGLKRAHWAVGVTTVHLLWTGKAKSAGPSIRIPGMKRNKQVAEVPANDTDFTDSELEPEGGGSTTRALLRGPTAIAKAASRAVGAGLSGSINSSRTNLDAMRNSNSVQERRAEVLLGAPYQQQDPNSRSPSPWASSVALNEGGHPIVPAAAVNKGRLRGVFAGLSGGGGRHLPVVERDDDALLGGHAAAGGSLAPPMRPSYMKRSVTDQDGVAKVSRAIAPTLPRRRRHSYSDESDLVSQTAVLSQRRLRIDVEMCATYFDLRQYEHHLASLCSALDDLDKTYAESAALLERPLSTRLQELKDLEERAMVADQRLDNIVGEAPKPDDVSKNEYHTQLFLAIVNDLEQLESTLDQAVGPQGNLTRRQQRHRPVTDNWTRMMEGLYVKWTQGLDMIRARAHDT